jgi:hypothetical protein
VVEGVVYLIGSGGAPGGGLKMGQVIGKTDSRAERSANGLITFQSILATIYGVLGVDPGVTLPDFNGRPQYLLDQPEGIRELGGGRGGAAGGMSVLSSARGMRDRA